MNRALPTYDIDSDVTLCSVLSDLKHALKARPHGGLCDEFDNMLNMFLAKHRLDMDLHDFAALPPASQEHLPEATPERSAVAAQELDAMLLREKARALDAFHSYLDDLGIGEYDRGKAEAQFLKGLADPACAPLPSDPLPPDAARAAAQTIVDEIAAKIDPAMEPPRITFTRHPSRP